MSRRRPPAPTAAAVSPENVVGTQVTPDNLHVLGKNSRFRASKQGMKAIEGRITGNALTGGGGQNGFSTDPALTAYVGGVVEVEQRHPVNINTAKRETLAAMFEGVKLFGDDPSRVTRGAAEMLRNPGLLDSQRAIAWRGAV